MHRFIKRITLAATLAVAVPLLTTNAANAQFTENFDSPIPPDGRVLFTADASYDGIEDSEALGVTGGDNDGNSSENGRIVQSDGFGDITQDQSGTGYFLFAQSNSSTLAGEVWGTITPVAVLANSDYEFSFYLTNQNTTNNAQIEGLINGVSVGGPVTATETFLTSGWQQFTFNWNSGASTTATLVLRNQVSGGIGNDFGIDTITLRGPILPAGTAPEPGTFALLGLGLVGGIVARRRKGIA